MKKPILGFVKDLKSNKKLRALDEASTKQAVVLRLLSLLALPQLQWVRKQRVRLGVLLPGVELSV